MRRRRASACESWARSPIACNARSNLHLFQDTKRVLTDVDFGAEKKQNRAIREFLTARGYVPDEGIYMASEGARHAYLHRETGLNVDVFADELYFCHRIPFKDRLDLDSPTICTTDLLLGEDADRRDQPEGLQGHGRADARASALEPAARAEVDRRRLYHRHDAPGLGLLSHLHHQPEARARASRRVPLDPRGSAQRDSTAASTSCSTAIEAAPKTLGWKMRSKIGTRSRWYQEVSEKSDQY